MRLVCLIATLWILTTPVPTMAEVTTRENLSAEAVAEAKRESEDLPRYRDNGSLSVVPGTASAITGSPATTEHGQKKSRDIRLHGRIGYYRSDGVFVGLDGARVSLVDEDIFLPNYDPDNCGRYWERLYGANGEGWQVFTDSQGYFDVTVRWSPCLTCENDPDIYLRISLVNRWARIMDDPIEEDVDGQSTFCTGVWDDFEGTEINFGTLIPQTESDVGEMHVFNTITRAGRWLFDRGYEPTWPTVMEMVVLPSYPQTERINGSNGWRYVLGSEDYWNETVHASLYVDYFLEAYGQLNTLNFCNGLCDGGGCDYCLWCPENEQAAVQEGFKRWFGSWITATIPNTYGHPTYYSDSLESLGDCGFIAESPEETVGHVAAFLWDAVDLIVDDHPEYPGFADHLVTTGQAILDVYANDSPTSPDDLVTHLKNRLPGLSPQICQAAANCGLDVDQFAPAAPTNLDSDSHPVGQTSSDTTFELSWTPPFDDCSGVAGYSLEFTNTPQAPNTSVNIGAQTTLISSSLSPGTWYFNLRAVDGAGNWSLNYATYGPFTIADPTPADLAHEQRSGWVATVVPRSFTGASSGNVPLTPTLFGDGRTFWNVAPKNIGGLPTGMPLGAALYVDGNRYFELFTPGDPGGAVFPSLNGFGFYEIFDEGPVYVPPGRHMFGVLLDSSEEIVEMDELDNGWARAWSWEPTTIAADVSLGATSVPDYDGGWEWWSEGTIWPNSLGVRFETTGRWNAFYAFTNDENDDFDLHMYQPTTGPTDGFFTPLERSLRGAGFLDALFINQDALGVQRVDVGIIQGDLEPDTGSVGYGHVTSETVNFGVDHFDQLDPGEALHLREFFLDPANTGPVSIVLEMDPADGKLTTLRLDSDYTFGHIGLHNGIRKTDEQGYARMLLTLPDPGYMCVVIYRNHFFGDYFDAVPYRLRIETTPPDLRPDLATGWHAPLVPRPTNDGTTSSVPAPTNLVGWQPATWFNFAQENIGPTSAPGPILTSLRVDGSEILSYPVNPGIGAGTNYIFNNIGVFSVRGGRHTIGIRSDSPDDVYELLEDNNAYGAQWAWSPLSMSSSSPVLGLPQPAPRTGGWEDIDGAGPGALWYNADGFRTPNFDPPTTETDYWVAIAAVPGANSDVDLRLHDLSDDPQTAFTTPLAYSGWGPGQTDFILINYLLAPPGSYDLGALDISGNEGYQYDIATAPQPALPEGSHGLFTLGTDELVGLHEFWFEQPSMVTVELENVSGGADLGFSIHGWQLPYQGKSDHVETGMNWLEPEGANEQIRTRLDEAGFYCIAVWKSRVEDAPKTAQYQLHFLSVTGGPPITQPATSEIVSIYPNPFNPRTEIEFRLEREDDVRLSIYDLRGKLVRTLRAGRLPLGTHRATWNGVDERGSRVASGVYLVQFEAGARKDRRKITLVK